MQTQQETITRRWVSRLQIQLEIIIRLWVAVGYSALEASTTGNNNIAMGKFLKS
jgi:hypothetical protein